MWFLLIPAVFSADPVESLAKTKATSPAVFVAADSANAERPNKIRTVSLSSLQAQSNHFIVRSVSGGPLAEEVARECETLCAQLRKKWLNTESPAGWPARCEVILHRTEQSYLAAVGSGGKGTLGSSLVRFSGKQVSFRRIDLLAPKKSTALSALPHELTHVVLADRFGQQKLPRWADEGLATLADPVEKQRLHQVDLHRGLATGRSLRLAELLFSTDYPAPEKRAVYYGASLSLVKFLSTLEHPERVIQFVELSTEQGYSHALREVYKIESFGELERRWHAHLAQSR